MSKKLVFIILGVTLVVSKAAYARIFDKGSEEKIRLVANNDTG